MAKKLIIIPGLGENIQGKNYRGIVRGAKNLKFKVKPIKIIWDTEMDMSDYITQAEEQLPPDLSDSYVLGFSFGAYIAYQIALKNTAKGYIFCSTSPYFSDDIPKIPQASREYFGSKLFSSFKKYKVGKTPNVPGYFFIGKEDWQLAIDRAKSLYTEWNGKKSLKIITGVEHELCDIKYEREIMDLLKML